MTIIPPNQYAERFRKALDEYFLMIPGRREVRTTIDKCLTYVNIQING